MDVSMMIRFMKSAFTIVNPALGVASVFFGLCAAALVGFAASAYYPVSRRRLARQRSLNIALDEVTSLQQPLFDPINWLATVPIPDWLTSRLGTEAAAKKLEAAGWPHRLDARGYIRIKVLIQIILIALFLTLSVTGWLPLWGSVSLFVVFAAAFWTLSEWYLAQRHHERVEKINRATPDLVDLLVVGIEGGLSLYRVLRDVTPRFPAPLGDEMRSAMRQVELGASLKPALISIYERTGAEEFRQFVTPFLQSYSQGGKAAENLRALSEDMRERRKQRAQENGRKAATRVLMPMMLCIFPALLITLLGPALLGFFATLTGR